MFSITGYSRLSPAHRLERVHITWWEPEARKHLRRSIARVGPALSISRGLEGDNLELIARAMGDEAEGLSFRATPEGPVYRANLDRQEAAFVQLTSYFQDGYTLDGFPPALAISVPEGAVA